MKEDYLWDKIGNDAEIERLENALKSFRYQEIAPPALPSKIVPFEKKSPRRFFRLSLAFGAFAALAIVCLVVWLQFSKKNIEVASNSMPIAAPVTNEIPARQIEFETPKNLTTDKIEKFKSPQRVVESQVFKTTFVSSANRRNNSAERKVKVKTRENSIDQSLIAKKTPLKLTKEETYAYNQLMLALSITGSKLRLVKDKIDGIEEKTGGFENGR